MQWLIDTILAQLVQKNNYVDRGDVPTADFTIGDFTVDGNWHTLNLSGIIPINTALVNIRTTMRGTMTNKNFELRTKGNLNSGNVFIATTQAINIFSPQLGTVKANDNLEIEYRFSSASISHMYMVINGWWLSVVAQSGFQNRGDPSSFDFTTGDFTADNSWHDLDISNIVPSNTSCIACHIEFYYTVQDWMIRFRTGGNVYERNVFSAPQSTSLGFTFRDFTLPTDGLQSIAYKFDSYNFSACNLTIKGWWF